MEKENFEEYMNFFKSQSLKDKQKIIYDQLKLLSGFTNKLCETSGIENKIITNKELLDFENNNYTEDDFAEAIIVFINSIQNSICDFSSGMADIVDKI